MTATSGSIRFNTDSSKMEIYNGDKWWNIDGTSPYEQTGGGRGVFAGAVPASDTIQYINIASTGDSIDFGDLLEPRGHMSGGSNSTRGVLAGGQTNPGGPTAISEDIFHITIQTLASYNDFGNLATARWFAGNGRSNSTRVLFAGGGTPSEVNTIDYVTIASTGNSSDFGDLTTSAYGMGSGNASNAVRAVFLGGTDAPDPHTTVIQYNTFATLGNSQDFGDLTSSRRGGGSVSDCRRAVLAGGRNPSDLNVIDYVQLMSPGNAVDYGDLLAVGSFNCSGASNAHGGLG